MVAKAWTTFVASTTARASEVMGMFGFMEGSIVPHSTGTLANNQFSLGTTTAKWLDLFADKITISTGTSSFAGTVNMSEGVNVGTATGATTGQIKTSGLIAVNTSGYLGQINSTRVINTVDGSVGSLSLSGLNATGSQVMYGAITAIIRANSIGTESGGLSLRTLNSGALVDGINITPSGGLNIGTATGATAGQISASAGFFNGTSGYGYNCTANPGQANSRSWRLMNDDSGYGDLYLKRSSTNNNTINTNVAFWDKDGNFTQLAGLNVGTATGATTGEIKCTSLTVTNGSSSIRDIGGGSALQSKILSIGAWDMNGTTTLPVSAFAGADKRLDIRGMTAVVRNDAGDIYNFEYGGACYTEYTSGTTIINLGRYADAGKFQNTNFDGTGFNRGYVYLIYV